MATPLPGTKSQRREQVRIDLGSHATQARGRTRIHGAGELRVKESDRVEGIVKGRPGKNVTRMVPRLVDRFLRSQHPRYDRASKYIASLIPAAEKDADNHRGDLTCGLGAGSRQQAQKTGLLQFRHCHRRVENHLPIHGSTLNPSVEPSMYLSQMYLSHSYTQPRRT